MRGPAILLFDRSRDTSAVKTLIEAGILAPENKFPAKFNVISLLKVE
jgi:hypothetical protein